MSCDCVALSSLSPCVFRIGFYVLSFASLSTAHKAFFFFGLLFVVKCNLPFVGYLKKFFGKPDLYRATRS